MTNEPTVTGGENPRPILYSQAPPVRGMHSQPYELVPLAIAREVADLVTEACKIVHDPRHVFLGDPGAPPFSDAEVDELCRALQVQLDREGPGRTRPGATCITHGTQHTHWYHLSDLPAARRRALAERIWRVKQAWGGSMPVYREGEPLPAKLHRDGYAGAPYDGVYVSQ